MHCPSRAITWTHQQAPAAPWSRGVVHTWASIHAVRVWKHAGQDVDGGRGVQGAWPSGGRTARPLAGRSTGKGWVKDHAYGDGWVKKHAGWKWTGAQYYDAKWVKKAITRLVLLETLGGIAPPTKQFLHVFAKEAVGTNTDRRRCMGRRRRAPPPLSSSTTRSRSPWRRWRATPKPSTSRRARTKMRTNLINSPERECQLGQRQDKQEQVTGCHAGPCREVPRTWAPPPFMYGSRTRVVSTDAVVGSLVMWAAGFFRLLF